MSEGRFLSPFSAVLDGRPFASTLDPDDTGDDERHLAAAIDEAERGVGRTWPNPPVGAVVTRGKRVIAKGFHAAAGQRHGEVVALDEAGRRGARGATLYVTLEPCTHFGRTPPCVDRVLDDGVARVVVGAKDPNPKVSGRGIAKLRRHGVAVDVVRRGPVAARARALLAPFASAMQRRRPYVVAKVAATLDGRVAAKSGHARWVTCPASRQKVHELRDRVDAVMVGSGTVLADDPQLTVRDLEGGRRGRNPLRVVVDGRLRTRPQSRVYGRQPGDVDDKPHALVLTTAGAKGAERFPVEAVACGEGEHVALDAALLALGARGVTSLLVEPGPALLAALLEQRLVDELWWFTAPKLLGADAIPALPALGLVELGDAPSLFAGARIERIDDDVLFVGGLRYRG